MNHLGVRRAIEFLRSWLPLRYEFCDIPGFAVAISIGGEIVFNETYGYANLDRKEPLTNEHLFRIASHSKTFTGTLIMQLHEQRKLNIDDAVVLYLPWLKKHPDSRISSITLRQVLSHSAGLCRDGLRSDFWQLFEPFPSRDIFRAEMLKADLTFDNNTKMKYSNIGYALLGDVIETVTGESFETNLSRMILQPLDLVNVGSEPTRALENRVVSGHTRNEFDRRRIVMDGMIDTNFWAPATGFYSNAADLCRYFDAHFIGSGKLLKDETKKEMQRTQWRVADTKFNQEYGLGLAIENTPRRRLFGHAGGFPGQSTHTLCHPESRTVVSVLTNAVDAEPGMINKAIYAILDQFQIWSGFDYSDKSLDKFEGRFFCLWDVKQFVRAGDRFFGIRSTCWNPFAWEQEDIEELEVVDSNTLRITKANGYRSPGELVKFNWRDDGHLDYMQFGAHLYFTRDEYEKRAREYFAKSCAPVA